MPSASEDLVEEQNNMQSDLWLHTKDAESIKCKRIQLTMHLHLGHQHSFRRWRCWYWTPFVFLLRHFLLSFLYWLKSPVSIATIPAVVHDDHYCRTLSLLELPLLKCKALP
jgi:hypothetical protein